MHPSTPARRWHVCVAYGDRIIRDHEMTEGDLLDRYPTAAVVTTRVTALGDNVGRWWDRGELVEIRLRPGH